MVSFGTMKTLATILGKVIQFNEPPEPSIVSLVNKEKNESCETKADSARLKAHGINTNGCEFEITILRDDRGRETSTIQKIGCDSVQESGDFAI